MRLFSRAPRTVEHLAVAFSPLLGGGDRSLAREELPGRRRLAREHVIDRSLHHDRASVDPRSGAHLHQVVGGADRVLVVLHDDDRVPDVAQALQRGDHLHVVLRVQADARLVEHVEHSHQPRPDLRGQPDPLRLTAGERAGATVEVQVVQSDAQEQLEPAADLLEHLPAGIGAAAGRLDGAQERVELVEIELAELVDGLACNGEAEPGGPEPRAVAVGAGVLDHHAVEPGLHPGVRLAFLPVTAVAPLDPPGDSAEADLLALPVVAASLRLRRRAEHDLLRSMPLRIAWRTGSGSFSHGVSREKPSAFARLYITRPSQVSGLYLNASRTKQPPRMLRLGCFSLPICKESVPTCSILNTQAINGRPSMDGC